MRDELREEIILAVTPMEGWCSPEKAVAMADLILREKPRVVVELGVFGGRSVIPQAMALRENGKGKIYGIDPWKKEFAVEGVNDPANNEWWQKLDLEHIHQCAVREVWKRNLDEHVIYIRAASQHCKGLFGVIDVLHIDGDHSELTSCRDVENYLPLVRSGGFVWFDDADWTTTQAALSIVASQCEQLFTIKGGNVCTLFKKK